MATLGVVDVIVGNDEGNNRMAWEKVYQAEIGEISTTSNL